MQVRCGPTVDSCVAYILQHMFMKMLESKIPCFRFTYELAAMIQVKRPLFTPTLEVGVPPSRARTQVKSMQCPHVCMFDKSSCFWALCLAPYQKIHPLGFLESFKSTCSLQRQVVRWEVVSCVVLLKYDMNSMNQDHTMTLKAYEQALDMVKLTFSKRNFDPHHNSVDIKVMLII